jgi:methionyl-tRNA synthetase
VTRWFNISFDHFGRTSTEKQTEITQDIYLQVRKNDMLLQKSEEMTYCTGCERSVPVHATLSYRSFGLAG